MATFNDADVFIEALRSPMVPCTEPTASDFDDDVNTLIWTNIAGEMRIYSFDGVNVQYQTLNLSGKITV